VKPSEPPRPSAYRRLLLGLLVILAGCMQQRVAPAGGTTSIRAIAPPALSSLALGPTRDPQEGDTREVLLPAQPLGDRPIPPYPAKALAANAGWVVIAVRIAIDESGRVIGVEPSPFGYSTGTRFRDAFLAEIRATVGQWRFTPAQIRTDRVVSLPEGLAWECVGCRPSESVIDLAFNFSERAGSLSTRELPQAIPR
jgi:hypothetical protein